MDKPLTFSQRIENLRQARKLSKFKLSQRVGITEWNYYLHDTGRLYPSLPTLQRYADAFEMTLNELLDGVECR